MNKITNTTSADTAHAPRTPCGPAVWHALLACIAACLMLALPASARAQVPSGKAQLTLDIEGIPIEVYTYKPERHSGTLLLTLHGVGRNASGYRDSAVPLADRQGFVVVAPLLDRKRFPTWRYQHGGIARRSGGDTYSLQAEARWTGALFLKIVDAVRALEAKPDAPYYLLGHSGGAQSLSRVAGFMPTGARRIVLANAGSYLWPALETRFPDGYGALPGHDTGEAALRQYLAQPLTLLLGTADVKQDPDLPQREGAAAQGANRYERGHNAYRAARSLAQARGWAFNWTLIEVPGVGHSARRMFASDAAASAFDDAR